MEEHKKNDKEYCVGPLCYHCGGMHNSKHVMLRWVIGLAIITITFWLGVKIGELKSSLGFGGYGWGMGSGYYRQMPMMQGYYGDSGINSNLPWMMR